MKRISVVTPTYNEQDNVREVYAQVKAVLAKDAYFCVAKGTGIALEHLDTYKKSIIAKR